MADSKVSDLASATSIGGGDVFYVVQSNTSKKVSANILFNNISNPTLSGNIVIGGTPQSLAAPGIINVTTPITHLSADATGGTLQIPAGTQGQFKLLTMTATAGGSYTVATSNIAGNTSIVFDAVGDTVLLYFTNSKWAPVASSAALDLTNISSNVIPSVDSVFDLGSPTNQWKSLFVSNNTIFIGGTPLTVSNGELVIGSGEESANIATVAYVNGAVANVDGGGNVSSLVNGAFTVSLGANGTLAAPGNVIISGKVESDSVVFDTSAGISVEPGQIAWNNSDGTLDVGTGYGGVVVQVGQETHYVVRNATGSQIENGTALYCSGVTGGSGRIEVSPMIGDGSVDPIQFIGLATMNINNGVNGVATWFGYVRGLDTRGTANTAISVGDEDWSVGDKLYVHPTAPGKLTSVEPEAPNTKICVAVVINRNETAGVLFVRPTTNLVLSKLSDVEIDTPQDSELLQYVSANTRWEATSNIVVESITYTNDFVVPDNFEVAACNSVLVEFTDGSDNSTFFAQYDELYLSVLADSLGTDLRLNNLGVTISDGIGGSSNLTVIGNVTANTVNASTSFGLPVYATDAARDTAIPSPQTGMMVYVSGGEGAGLQVRGANNWNTVSQTSN